jgi:hypothetical protein
VTLTIWKKLLLIDRSGLTWLYYPALLPAAAVVLGGLILRTFRISVPTLTVREPYTWAVFLGAIILIWFTAPLNLSPFIYFQF